MKKIIINQFNNKIIFCIVIFALITSCRNISSIVGQKDITSKKIYSKDTEGGNGEGYLFEIYELDKKTIEKFVNDSSKVLYPKENRYVDTMISWKKTPFVNNDNIKELIFSNYIVDTLEQKHLKSLEQAMVDSLSYYSYGYSEAGENVYKLIFYLLEVETCRLFVFEHSV